MQLCARLAHCSGQRSCVRTAHYNAMLGSRAAWRHPALRQCVSGGAAITGCHGCVASPSGRTDAPAASQRASHPTASTPWFLRSTEATEATTSANRFLRAASRLQRARSCATAISHAAPANGEQPPLDHLRNVDDRIAHQYQALIEPQSFQQRAEPVGRCCVSVPKQCAEPAVSGQYLEIVGTRTCIRARG